MLLFKILIILLVLFYIGSGILYYQNHFGAYGKKIAEQYNVVSYVTIMFIFYLLSLSLWPVFLLYKMIKKRK